MSATNVPANEWTHDTLRPAISSAFSRGAQMQRRSTGRSLHGAAQMQRRSTARSLHGAARRRTPAVAEPRAAHRSAPRKSGLRAAHTALSRGAQMQRRSTGRSLHGAAELCVLPPDGLTSLIVERIVARGTRRQSRPRAARSRRTAVGICACTCDSQDAARSSTMTEPPSGAVFLRPLTL